MNQILLADEINRTSPKTQSSLLEAMAEGQVTVDGVAHPLPRPFLVLATQNPIEFLGTYPLPEAQLDRFMMRLSIGYPGREEELRMASQFLEGRTPDRVRPVCQAEDIIALQKQAARVLVQATVLGYIEDIVLGTREDPGFLLGASPRALLALLRAAQARALLQERDFVKPDDVKAVVMPVLLHRLVLSSEAKLRRETAEDLLDDVIHKIKIPM